ncbi:hypothetical protein BJP25_28585 [Actinokineospora bangkokensis]|uniref:N-acetyltransferase domain-containing protein n=1 Tax=Actinokineospora bangkokensis TaxID=1193682 RepID=A0A1Q9LGR7_9PSEU|nr:hypothetical protein BJP25_28585 [Actinokineospora bangkokensis]
MIRQAVPADFPRLREVEVLAGAAFRDVGMAWVAEDEPPSAEVLGRFAAAGRAWVCEVARAGGHDTAGVGGQGTAVVGGRGTAAAGGQGTVGAYLLAERVDGRVHVAQVSVDPAYRGMRLGAALIDHVDDGGGITLTTFADVPWNAPHYRRLGFRVVEATGGLALVVRREAALGLDPATRVCMIRP